MGPVFRQIKEDVNDGWVIIIAIAHLPNIYRIHKRLAKLEEAVSRLKRREGVNHGDRPAVRI
jgi:hypothetical protein